MPDASQISLGEEGSLTDRLMLMIDDVGTFWNKYNISIRYSLGLLIDEEPIDIEGLPLHDRLGLAMATSWGS